MNVAKRKVSVSLDEDLVEELEREDQGLSAQVNIAVRAEIERRRRHLLLVEFLDQLDAEHNEQPTAEYPKRALVAAAARRGLTAEQLESAIRSFSETQDPKDRGIAAYLEGQYQQAEELLDGVAEKKERDLVETLRYLGATRYQQAKYRAAAPPVPSGIRIST
jgi:hypothetical protein